MVVTPNHQLWATDAYGRVKVFLVLTAEPPFICKMCSMKDYVLRVISHPNGTAQRDLQARQYDLRPSIP